MNSDERNFVDENGDERRIPMVEICGKNPCYIIRGGISYHLSKNKIWYCRKIKRTPYGIHGVPSIIELDETF